MKGVNTLYKLGSFGVIKSSAKPVFKYVNRGFMKTTVLGVRLNDYQREKLRKYGSEADVVRILVDGLIDGKIVLNGDRIVPPVDDDAVDLSKFEKLAEKKRMSTQGLLDLIAEQLGA